LESHDRAEKGSHTHEREFPGLQAISVEPTAPEDAEEEAGLGADGKQGCEESAGCAGCIGDRTNYKTKKQCSYERGKRGVAGQSLWSDAVATADQSW
jgi:hypothetical protein